MPKKIAITGGKGGTGKSTVATALANKLSENNKILLVDADVDCPDDNIILNIELKKIKDVKNMIPEIDKEKCINCGRCSEVCRENAIISVKDRKPIVMPEQCSGCKACKIACPVNAITEKKQIIGEIFEGGRENIKLVTGKIKPGIEESSLIINDMKKYIENEEDYDKFDYIIFDTAAGTHCPVISALIEVELGIAVTEPTPLGKHDLELILELMKELDVKSKIVLNRSDIADRKVISKVAESKNIEIIADIPYSKDIEKAYSAGEVIKHKSIEKIAESLENKKNNK